MMDIREILKATAGRLISGSPETRVDPASISIDSRTIGPGQFFIPIKGLNFNGEEFIEAAFKKGAMGTFTTQLSIPGDQRGKVIIRVKDTMVALQRLAHYNRTRFTCPVIGVTGSNGKTTVKDMIAKVLSQKYNVLKNEGTKNNHIGLPLTLLKLNHSHDMCVVEMGTNHRGEIRLLAQIALPTVAVMTNIGPSHLEYLRDLKGVFAAKREILESLGRGSLAVINGDDEYLSTIKSKVFKVMKFGFNDTNDFHASGISVDGTGIGFTLNDSSHFTLNLIGAHNVSNALAAISVAYNFDISYRDTKKALSEYSPSDMRLDAIRVGDVTVIDDAYNSNPSSMRSAIEALADYPAKGRWVVSADMLELGRKEEEFHKAVGEAIARSGFSGLITFGDLSRHTSRRALECGMDKNKIWHCSDRAKIADILKKSMEKGDAVLVKGSRAMKMEEVIENLKVR
ncbi:MAG: UDP-N-acetylmuramoyl-tripeptide--D-alanyl-D-alanine ligase [Candidatus Omnitrophica bacterium]|nr:UDP-N-acetylmuramoyl-tripeptide--D-alanyl-D-alanine ligase [Candidatus Omnitrophota bacterium]